MNTRAVFITALVFLLCMPALGQEAQKVGNVYQVPFATTGNRIDLSVANVGGEDMAAVRVISAQKPEWLTLDTEEVLVSQVGADEDEVASFGFSVDRSAPIGERGVLRFEIISGDEVIGAKEFALAVEAPQEAALDQNFPNPFSQATTIGYDVPEAGIVQIEVYDMLGRQVAVVLDEEKQAGHHRAQWDAMGLASGIYFYVLKAQGMDGRTELLRNKMTIVH